MATLVARGVDSSELFAAVADEMRRCLSAMTAALFRFETGDEVTLVASASDPALPSDPVGQRMTIEGDNLAAMVLHTGRPARQDSLDDATGSIAAVVRELGICAAVGAPIIVDGRLWGVATVASVEPGPLPSDTEQRVAEFAGLVATAIANAAARDDLQTSRDQLAELAEQQAALRRAATLVARGAAPSEIFEAVVDELLVCFHADNGGLLRYEGDGTATLLASRTAPGMDSLPIGLRMTLDGDNIPATILKTGLPARQDSLEHTASSLNEIIREMGVQSGVGVPVIVDGEVWGVIGLASSVPKPLPEDTEERIGDFTDLVATAIANAVARDELIASRARIVAAADDARRRLERDLHDGAQQRLVSLALQLRQAQGWVRPDQHDLEEQLSGIVSGLTAVSTDLQEISRGIHPAILSDGGLGPALRTLARRCAIPANVDVLVEGRLPESVEVAAYYVVAEALTNAAKYAQASEVTVCAEVREDNLCLSIQDDGIGGADSRKGSGLIGLKDRVEVLGGHMNVISPLGCGTALHVTMPLTG
ncbi:GAF domain-containing protein [Mycobacterium sp. 852002-51057_SCH5723018]|uniref:sensor histidine kinase n=1 Tax=Mycobacterium sp. 852002-51057_SCH5723018 TaxID=1834094 RepID=UPI0007FBFE3A|nr:GAF domain-containing protein [Mycobacterium sp. 852002-51057_SCH5723018]OBG19764.1 hypothetical protein A5764_16195 [Mycobacterium sp. 852002-51057_SCH5723018]